MRASRFQTDTVDPSQFAPGQRWISETQAEYGLALILTSDQTEVKVYFPAVDKTITYASRNAPLRRVVFEVGDTLKDQEGNSFLVDAVREEDKRLVYIDHEGRELPESRLSDTMNVQRPEQRLLSGVSDEGRLWALRQSAIRLRHEARVSEVRGLTGARISLIPHQMYIAQEVANRHAPRVLLADEVGLGKTIEASLILHRLHLTGRAQRILILVPDALVNQWFVELYRRFSMTFAIFDEERAVAIEEEAAAGDGDDAINPFYEDQLVICATSWLATHPHRAAQVAAGGWDLTIVDEAHHLEWSVEASSPEYDAVAAIAATSTGLLLLTATPEQLGREGHFARLRLLDPARFSDLKSFLKESDRYKQVSALADGLKSDQKLKAADLKQIRQLLGEEAVEGLNDKDSASRRDAVRMALMDLYGTGRVLFRNRRIVLDTFPTRIAHLAPLSSGEGDILEVKVGWLASQLKAHPDEKFLLIAHSREMAEAIESELRFHINATAAVFHEGLTLLQRDKNAAWFADEDGARVLICSEIGSEGRNFQFAHHLVLFDLPPDPGLLEQRIGRLDRIGQSSDIHLHVPYITGSSEELWALWYHRGLGAFEHTLHGAHAISRKFRAELKALSQATEEERGEAFPGLLDRTQAFKQQLDEELEKGRDHLLELSSFDRDQGQALVSQIQDLGEDRRLEQLMLSLFDHFGVTVEDLDNRCYLLLPEHLFAAEAFPGLPEDGVSVTFDRTKALEREDIVFLSYDHPMVTSAIDSLLSKDLGNAGFFRIEHAGEQLLMVEAVSVLECVAPEHLHAERFLPAKPIRQMVDQRGANRSEDFSVERIRREGRPGPKSFLKEKSKALKATVPKLLEVAMKECGKIADEMRQQAIDDMEQLVGGELKRLETLQTLGHPVRDTELDMAREELAQLRHYLSETPLRVDSVRLILAMP